LYDEMLLPLFWRDRRFDSGLYLRARPQLRRSTAVQEYTSRCSSTRVNDAPSAPGSRSWSECSTMKSHQCLRGLCTAPRRNRSTLYRIRAYLYQVLTQPPTSAAQLNLSASSATSANRNVRSRRAFALAALPDETLITAADRQAFAYQNSMYK